MRILIAGQTYYPAFNGQAIFTINLAEGLARRGHEVLAVVPVLPNTDPIEERNGVQIQQLDSLPLNLLHPDAAYTLFPEHMVNRLIKDFQPDIIHIHDHYSISQAAVKIARHQHIRVIGTNHFMPENLVPYLPLPQVIQPGMNKLLWMWMLDLYNQLDAVTAPSRTAAVLLRQQGLTRPVYPISCGIDPHEFKPDPDLNRRALRRRYGLDSDRKLFLFVGRVDGEKRLDVILEALKVLDRDDIQFGIAGKGAARSKLESLAAELGLGERVHFTGFIPAADLPSLLNSADIFAMPSEAELLSIATLEAMACGRPVLAARSNALPELVEDGHNGFLFQPGEVQDAARKMAWLVDHSDQWGAMGLASLERVQAHHLDHVLQSYEGLYEAQIGRSSAIISIPGGTGQRTVKRSGRELVNRL